MERNKEIDETEARMFLSVAGDILKTMSQEDLRTKFPTDTFITVFGGNKGETLHFVVSIILTTDSNLVPTFTEDFKTYAKHVLKIDRIFADFKPRNFFVPK